MSDYICYCKLTGFPHVVSDGRGCSMCQDDDRARAVTPETTEAALKWCRNELEKVQEDEDTDDDEGEDTSSTA